MKFALSLPTALLLVACGGNAEDTALPAADAKVGVSDRRYVTTSTPFMLEPQQPSSAVAACRVSDRLVSGGCSTFGTNVVLRASYPLEDLRSWECTAIDESAGAGGSASLRAYALCER